MKRLAVFSAVSLIVGCATSVDPTGLPFDAGTSKKDSASVEPDTTAADDDTGAPADTTVPEPFDTGSAPFDTGSAPFDTGSAPFDTGTKPDTSSTSDTGGFTDKTVGLACTSDFDCDKTFLGVNICTRGAFGGDSLYPTSVCIGTECDPGLGDKIMGCDADRGLCLATSSGGICLPACEFDDKGTAPTGCIGKNKCNAYGWGKDAVTSAATGVGYCFGGCKADGDCPVGEKCQVETGLCVKTKDVYTKLPGDPCTDLDAKDPAKCNCLYTTADKKGYCANACFFGETTCATGFTCDPSLPRVALLTTDVVFTKVPLGMAGYCLKNCTTDADCSTLNGYCDEMAGTGKKTCQIGKRPCAKTADCPTGKTCTGATATTLGRCG